MPASLLEIVELDDGEIVLQRENGDDEPLVIIRFSEEARLYLLDQDLEVARAMIQAGIQAVSEISEQGQSDSETEEGEAPRVLH